MVINDFKIMKFEGKIPQLIRFICGGMELIL